MNFKAILITSMLVLSVGICHHIITAQNTHEQTIKYENTD